MNKKKRDIFFMTLLLLALAFTVTYALINRQRLDKNHKLTVGIPYSCSSNGRGNAGGLYIEYTFKVDGEVYKGTEAFRTSELSEGDTRDYFLGTHLPVVYWPPNPSNSQLLILPIQFERFGYSFPDSLNWILKYVK